MLQKKRLLLIILDGYGYSLQKKGNAPLLAQTPFLKKIFQNPILLNTTGTAVWLANNDLGGSEVGHLTLGAGRVIKSTSLIFSQSLLDNNFWNRSLSKKLLQKITKKKKLHLMTLFSTTGVHAKYDQLVNFLNSPEITTFSGKIYLHLILDGRDMPPCSALALFKKFQKEILTRHPNVILSTAIGRYFAMDRDQHWKRIEQQYLNLTSTIFLEKKKNLEQLLTKHYLTKKSDEFFPATRFEEKGIIQANDPFLFLNFRSDRAKQLTYTLTDPNFKNFSRPQYIPLNFYSIGEYANNLKQFAIFPNQEIKNTLGELISKQGLKQLRIAETEKFAHVTYFFNGKNDHIFPGEDRIIIPSPAVTTYDLQPKMSADQVSQTLQNKIATQKYDFILCNFANPDMLGHTGKLDKAIEALEFLDGEIKKIHQLALENNYNIIITADHGNCDEMGTKENPLTAHSKNPVPLYLYPTNLKKYLPSNKKLGLDDISNIVKKVLELK